jgi:hypothetical protein
MNQLAVFCVTSRVLPYLLTVRRGGRHGEIVGPVPSLKTGANRLRRNAEHGMGTWGG